MKLTSPFMPMKLSDLVSVLYDLVLYWYVFIWLYVFRLFLCITS